MSPSVVARNLIPSVCFLWQNPSIDEGELVTAGSEMAKPRSNKKSIEIKNIKASNDAYYKALSARDIRAMQKVWTCAADNILIAPPSNPHVRVGWAN
jgi:hypothetical protein